MKHFVFALLSTVVVPAFANGAETCGQLKSYTSDHVPGVSWDASVVATLQDKSVLPVGLGWGQEAVLASALASNLTICFRVVSGSQEIYIISSLSK